jgi:predicted MPP superfamily phosphohydrolase
VKLGLETIQNLAPDLILFTGDLVNNTSDEFDKFIPYLKALSAPLGKFAILGNHDYGLYYKWESDEAKAQNEQRIRNHHDSIGFDLLENQNRTIEKNGAKINLLGVENWGRPPFPPKGNLDKAKEGIVDNTFNLLLSHDPHHWEDIVLNDSQHIHLTLSGHTHGMQMGIELPGWKWSPVSLRYKNWAGLYQEKGQYLYVNRGFGHIGFPGRVGIKPEITFLELKSKN